MQFSVKSRDGPARIGEFFIENKKVITPNIFFVNTSRFKVPKFADILITNQNIKIEKPVMKILENFSPNYIVYPKDVSKEIHLFAIKSNKKKKDNFYIIPGNKEVINESVKDNDSVLFIVSNASQLFPQHSTFVDFILYILISFIVSSGSSG